MRILYLVIFLILVAMNRSVLAQGEGNKITYRAYKIYEASISSNPIVIDIRGYVREGDLELEFKSCSKKSKWICITNPEFDFAVPKVNSLNLEKWIFNGWSFNISKQLELSFFGNKEMAYEIKATQENRSKLFYYSFDKGLLGFSTTLRNGTGIIRWNSDKYGFGWEGYANTIPSNIYMTVAQESVLFEANSSYEYRMNCLYNKICKT